ncbi:ATP-dependent DNA ligase [Halomarina litorea]|uniref:ATP-dependent DNA ligase n=1 Tax=Halomarina litorea TaxID=2961595 RepID=UPI0020C4CBC4|nr:ATP-dependent DNA ligase [Halomarina sp. BCD28]
MEYAALVDVYRRLDATASNNEKTAILAGTFADADADHLPLLVTLVRGSVFAAWEPDELGVSSSLATDAVVRATGVDADRVAAWEEASGDLGNAAARAAENATQQTLFSTPLDVRSVVETFRETAGYEGAGSQGRRVDAVANLLSRADPEEARYVVRTTLGHLRVGVGEGTVRDAIALAFLTDLDPTDPDSVSDLPDGAVASVERAHQVTNDFRVVATTARDAGETGLADLDVELFRPVGAMLARKADSLAAGVDAVAPAGSALLEHKYDGARVQVHKRGEEVRVFTRRLADVTAQFPDLVAAVREGVSADACILDGEAVGVDPDTGRPVPFQEFSRRIKREHDVRELVEAIPVALYCFDCLVVDGESLLDAPLDERLARLDAVLDPVPGDIERAAHVRPGGEADAEAFYREAVDAGHEGVMLKNLEATYQPGRRVGTMMKVKPTMETLDLVVPRAQRSSGRRSDYLGRLFLACYDAEADAFREVGRLSTGYTDEELEALTARLEPLVEGREGPILDVRPEVVLEIEYEEIQASTEYDSGFALRFPRFLRVREDLAPTDADTLDRVTDRYESQSA